MAWAVAIQTRKIAISSRPSATMAPIEGERSTSRASAAETSTPASRRRLNS